MEVDAADPDPVTVLQADVPERRIPDRDAFQAHVFRILKHKEAFLHVAVSVVALHLHTSASRVFLLLDDLRVLPPNGRILPLGVPVERAAPIHGSGFSTLGGANTSFFLPT